MFRYFLIFIVMCGLTDTVFAQTKISVRAETVVAGEQVMLGEIARISGAAKSKQARLQSISLGYAPDVGLIREIKRERLGLMIRAAGFGSGDFLLEAPMSILIRRAGQKLQTVLVREEIERALFRRFEKSAVSVRLTRIEVPEQKEVPLGRVRIEVDAANIRNPFAAFSLPVAVRVDDAVVRRFSARIELEAFANVYVTGRELPKNARLRPTDAVLEKRRINRPLSEYLREPRKLRGIKLTRDLPGGVPLTVGNFVADIVVRSGDPVRIVGESGKFRIVINGEARASGRIGDRIAVKNLQSEKILQAVILDEGLVGIKF